MITSTAKVRTTQANNQDQSPLIQTVTECVDHYRDHPNHHRNYQQRPPPYISPVDLQKACDACITVPKKRSVRSESETRRHGSTAPTNYADVATVLMSPQKPLSVPSTAGFINQGISTAHFKWDVTASVVPVAMFALILWFVTHCMGKGKGKGKGGPRLGDFAAKDVDADADDVEFGQV